MLSVHACIPPRSGNEGPKSKDPSKYIRYIFNRIILENATVRAAAVSSLASFGAAVEGLRPRVLTLLQRALSDNDDEVGCGSGAGWLGGEQDMRRSHPACARQRRTLALSPCTSLSLPRQRRTLALSPCTLPSLPRHSTPPGSIAGP